MFRTRGSYWMGFCAIGAALLLAACGGGGGGGGGGGPTAKHSSITMQSVVNPGDKGCPTGGVEIFYGIDDNGNGLLEGAERDGSEVICNGGVPAWERLADRISFLQVNNGTWEFTAFNVHASFDPATPGLQSMAGRTAMGLFDAYAQKPSILWKGAIDATKDYLMAFMVYYVTNNGNPGPTTGTGTATDSYNISVADNSLSNFSFLKRYRDTVGFGLTAAEWTTVNEALTKMVTNYNTAEGDVTGPGATVLIDGILNHIVAARAGNPGLAPWDTARVLQVAVEFGLAPAEIAYAVARQKLLMDANTDGTVDFDATQFGGYLGVANSLDALILAGDTGLQAALLTKLAAGLAADGTHIVATGTGSDVSDDVQDSAYALGALKRAGDAQAAAVHTWLEAQVDGEGRIWFPQLGDLEWAVLDGEVLSAIVTAATPNSAPVANAGPVQNVVTGTLVTLDGSGSTDANGDPLTYAWTFVSGPMTPTLSDATVVNPTFTPDLDGSYVWSLVVNDGTVDSTADTVTITAAP